MTSNTAPMGKEELRRIAEEATPGDWRLEASDRGHRYSRVIACKNDHTIHYKYASSTSAAANQDKRDARFIATFNPSRVLEMMDREAELEGEIAALKASQEAIVEHAASAAANEGPHSAGYCGRSDCTETTPHHHGTVSTPSGMSAPAIIYEVANPRAEVRDTETGEVIFPAVRGPLRVIEGCAPTTSEAEGEER